MRFPVPVARAPSLVRYPSHASYMAESDLVAWWEGLRCGDSIAMQGGVQMYILDKGKRNRYDGPDIIGARLLTDAGIRVGDVECHLNERAWFEHGHHRDLRYNDVVLHVVSRKGRRRAITANGREVPIVVVPFNGVDISTASLCLLKGRGDAEQAAHRLDSLIRLRWIWKVSAMKRSIFASGDVTDAFYQESFRILGLRGNEHLFVRIAQTLSLREFRRFHRLEEVRAFLFQVSGLSRHGGHWRGVESRHDPDGTDRLPVAGVDRVVSPFEWNRGGIRPAAFPERRIAFGAVIVWALLQGWHPWSHPFCGDMSALSEKFGALLPGKGWCGEWLGNVILPFGEAWYQMRSGVNAEAHFRRWFQIDLQYTYGKLLRHFAPHFPRRFLTNFAFQQGLLALEDRYCASCLCQVCPLQESDAHSLS